MLVRSSKGEADVGEGADGAYVTDGADDDAEKVLVMVQMFEMLLMQMLPAVMLVME